MPATARALEPVESFSFPGRIVKAGDSGEVVVQIQHRLNELGCGPIPEDGDFEEIYGWRAIVLPVAAQVCAAGIQVYALFHEIGSSERLVTLIVLAPG